jgi:hypothetical protein
MLEIFFKAKMLLIKRDGAIQVLHMDGDVIDALEHDVFLPL